MSCINNDEVNLLHNTPVRRNTTESNLSSCSRILAPPENPNLTRRYTADIINLGTPECYSAIQLPVSSGPDSPYLKNVHGEEGDQSSLTVAVRVRPFNQRELTYPDLSCIVSMKNKETIVKTSSNQYTYSYDFSFWSFDKNDSQFASQEHVYKSLGQPLLVKAFQGYNTSLFAYGQTGSGKSYSIMGYDKEEGIVPRFSRELFERINVAAVKNAVKSSVEISFFEIYNEKIHDLLESVKDKRAKKTALKVREHPVLGPYIEGLSTHMVNSFEDIQCWINLGNKNRATAATGMNDKSSRSHSIFTMVLTQTKTQQIDGQKHDHSTTSKINLVDLAGSERQATSQCSGERFREGININKSLMTLGKVISLLSEISAQSSKKKVFIPYRDSILTWLLKESLGGNSRTAMIATISPANCHVDETLSTLRYAQQARFIVNRVRINEDTKTKKIQELMAEIKKLKNIASAKDDGNVHTASLEEISALRTELEKKEKELSEIKRTLEDKLTESEKKRKEQFKILQHSGIAFKVDNSLPHLVNLSADPQLTGVLLYLIKEGETKIGQRKPSSDHDIQLSGALIADNHCIINNSGNVVTIKPIKDAPTYVNGNLITEVTNLCHGDTVILGGNHFFRFVNSSDSEKKSSNQGELKDFDFAYKELIKTQEKRLAQELEDLKKQVQVDMLQQIDEEKHKTEELLEKQKTGYEVQLASLEDKLKEKNSQMKMSELENKELAEQIKKQKEELDVKLLEERRRQKEILQITNTISNNSQSDDLLLKALQKARDGAENNLKRLNVHLQETLNSSLSSTSTKSEETNVLQSPSLVYHQTMLTINSLMNLVDDVHSQGRQSIEEIKNKQQTLNKEMFDTLQSKQKKPNSPDITAGLYQTYLAILEGNAICRHLKKNIVFSRDDSLIDGNKLCTMVKCSHLDNKLCTFWSLDVFQNKLNLLRDIYENGDDSMEVVFSDEQLWETDEDWLNFTMCSDIQGLPVILTSPQHVKSNFRRFSSPGFSSKKPSTVNESFGNIKFGSYVSMLASICQHTSTFLKQEEQFVEWNLADQVLACFCEIICSVKTVIRIGPDHQQTLSGNPIEDRLCKELIFLLHKSYSLSSNNKLWMKTLRQGNLYIQSICGEMSSSVENIIDETTGFLLACSSQLNYNIQDYGKRIVIAIHKTLEVFAKLTLVTNQTLVLFDDENSEIIDLNICQIFKDCCDVVSEKTLKGALHSLNEWEMLSQSYTKANGSQQNETWKDIQILISTIKTLLEKNKDSFFHQNDKTGSLTLQFYKSSFNDSKEICFLVKNLVENVASIMLALKSSSNESAKKNTTLMPLFDVLTKLSQEFSSFLNRCSSDQKVSSETNDLISVIDRLKSSVTNSL